MLEKPRAGQMGTSRSPVTGHMVFVRPSFSAEISGSTTAYGVAP